MAALRGPAFGVLFYTTRLIRERTLALPTRDHVLSPADEATALGVCLSGRDGEGFIVVFIDQAFTLEGLLVAPVGGLSASIAEPRQVFKAAELANAAAVLLGHNYPPGNPKPSRADTRLARV